MRQKLSELKSNLESTGIKVEVVSPPLGKRYAILRAPNSDILLTVDPGCLFDADGMFFEDDLP